MLSIQVLGAGGRGEDYYLNKVARTTEAYYLGAGEAPGYWVGAGRHQLGLTGEVTADPLRTLLDGYQPGTGVDLLAQRRAGRVRGYDLTFNAPKSLSLLAALGQPELAEQIRAAHDHAVAAALGYLDRHAGHVRRGKDGVTVEPGRGLVGAAFRHRVSRAGDPHLHTHVVTANTVQGSDGRWYAVDGRALFREAKTAGMLYRSQLRHNVRDLGLAWTVRGNGLSEVEGIPAEVLRAFSQRAEEIQARLAELGLDGPRAAQVATLDTRRRKHPYDQHRLAADWQARADQLGFTAPTRYALLHRHHRAPVDRAQEQAAMLAPTGLTAAASHFHRRDVVQALCVARVDGDPIEAIEADAAAFLRHRDVVALRAVPDERHGDTRPPGHGETRYTTTDLLHLERTVITQAADRAHDGLGVVPAAVLGATLERHHLNPEQQLAAVRLLTGGAGVEVVIGVAGAGKTHLLGAVHDAWTAGGHHVVGAAVAARAAARLTDATGITTWTITRLLAELDDPRHGPMPPGSVIVVDEAGMLGSRDLAALHGYARRDQAKLVLVGDYRQLPEIDAGGLFRALAHRLAPVTLTRNMRQVHGWERAALGAIRDAAPPVVHAALDAYVDHGRVTVQPDVDAARDQLVTDWWTALHTTATSTGTPAARILAESPEAHVMLATRRRAVADLNTRARARLTDAGLLTGPDLVVTAGPLGERRFAVGDLVAARRNDYRNSGLLNGDLGTVTTVDPEAGTLTVTLPDGTHHQVSARYLRRGGLDHGYAHTLHRAQGLSAEHVFVDAAGDALYRESLYTTLSRGRQHTQLYATNPDRDHDTQLLRAEHHPPAGDPPPLTQLTTAATRSRAQRAALDLHDGGPGDNTTAVLRATHADHAADPHHSPAAADDADAAYRDHLRRQGITAERAARAGTAPHLTALGPPPTNNVTRRRTWRDAAGHIQTYRDRWHIPDTDHRPLGPAPTSADPPARHDDWHQARHALHQHRDATGAATPIDEDNRPLADATDDQLRAAVSRGDAAQRAMLPNRRAELAAAYTDAANAALDAAAGHEAIGHLRDQPRRQRLHPRRRRDHAHQLRAAQRRVQHATQRETAALQRAHALEAHEQQRLHHEHATAPERRAADQARDEINHRAHQRLTNIEHNPPRYLTTTLGPRPHDPYRRGIWRHAAHTIETYRLTHGITDPDQPLGPLDRANPEHPELAAVEHAQLLLRDDTARDLPEPLDR
ncbi:MAG TPA: MobF family relaxase [Mycobacteriales bacterium]|jgi:conjugative relaxase-like TrwC/TraI family protein|nr:MobF family relaxase [Mycobacteriales bacterium]